MRDCDLVTAPPSTSPPLVAGPNTTINNSINRLQDAARNLEPFDWLLLALAVLIVVWLLRRKNGGK
jgi:hypothetical protein